jgi:C4-type Zn-finger protein
MAAVPSLDPSRCPLCGQSNQCAMEIQRVTGQVQRQACICRACAADASAAGAD